MILLFLFLIFLYFINDDTGIRIVGTSLAILLAAIWFVYEYRVYQSARVTAETESPIRRFVLLSRDGEKEKAWYCEGMNSFLIGKGTRSREVDIELGDTHYCDYVSSEHAALNFMDGYWYIEDLGSVNGVGLKKKGEDYALRLKPHAAYKVDEGDIIYIAKAKILAR